MNDIETKNTLETNDVENLSGMNNNTDSSEVNETKKKSSLFWDIIRFAILAAIIVFPIRMFIASPFIVSGSSMDPTFATGHYLIVDQISYRFEKPKRGEVIVFRYPKNPSKFFIKRIIGLPGETVEIKNGAVYITNKTLKSSLIDESFLTHTTHENFKTTLSNKEYFVMGDNRGASSDSRVWGNLRKEFITGSVLMRLFPLSRIGVHPGKVKFN